MIPELNPLLDKTIMKRVMILLQYFGTGSALLLSVVKIAFPESIAKKPKKGEPATQGEILKKEIGLLKKSAAGLINEALIVCQGFKLSEEVSKFVNDWDYLNAGILKVPLLSEIVVNSVAANEVIKGVKEEMVNAIGHVEAIFRPVVKTLSSIDL